MLKLKRLSVAIATSLVLIAGIAGAPAYARNDPDNQVDIEGNLWRGTFVNLSGEDRPGEAQPNQYQYTTPQDVSPTQNAAGSNAATNGIYAALGDSVAAGLGLNGTTQCGQSSQAYPYYVANTGGYSLIDAACSGATAGDLFTRQGVSGPNLPPQLDTAFASGTPTLITITAGANDVRWADFIYKCYRSECGTTTDTYAANALLTAMQLKLYYAFSEIQQRSNGTPPTVIVTGYYNPLSSRCLSQQNQVTRQELRWLNSQREALNQTIQNVAASYPFVRYAPLNFTGHDICSSQPWVQGLSAPAPLHPNSTGQAAIARAVMGNL